jgi:predicted neutral ceramidase superfamily lipid hydrolase
MSRVFPIFISLLLVSCLTTGLDAADSVWKTGSAAIAITPTESMWMAGYAARNKPSEGVASDLYAKAFVLEDGAGHRGAIVTLDLISVPRGLRDNVAQRVEEQFKIPASAVMLNCSHTHCGPELRFPETPVEGPSAERVEQAIAYSKLLEEQLVELVGSAKESI